MESDSGVGTGDASSSGQGDGSSGYDSASTLTNDTSSTTKTNDTLQDDQSMRSGSSGFFSNPNKGNNHGSFDLDALPKQDMIDLFLRPESQIYKDEKTAVRIQMRPDQTIADLKEMVKTKTGIHPGQQYLVHEDTGTVFSGRTEATATMATRTIRSCNIKQGSWMKYGARNRGGGGGVC